MSREKTAVRPAYGKNEKRERLMGYILAAPAVILLVVFTVYPLIYLIYRSLFGGNLIAKDLDFVGIENYQTLFESEDFHKVLTNTLVYTLITVVLTIVLAVIIASWLHSKRNRKLNDITQTFIFTPHIF